MYLSLIQDPQQHNVDHDNKIHQVSVPILSQKCNPEQRSDPHIFLSYCLHLYALFYTHHHLTNTIADTQKYPYLSASQHYDNLALVFPLLSDCSHMHFPLHKSKNMLLFGLLNAILICICMIFQHFYRFRCPNKHNRTNNRISYRFQIIFLH